MVKAANMLLALFLALAPGMDAVRLLHVLDLCGFAGASGAHLHHVQVKCAHDHGHNGHHGQDSGKTTPEQECPHLKQLAHGTNALVLDAPAPFDLPAPPLALAPQLAWRPCACAVAPSQMVRPPPGPPRLGCVLLQI